MVFHWNQGLLIWLGWLTNEQHPTSSLPGPGSQNHTTMPGFLGECWGSEPRSSSLHHKHFTYWVMSPTPRASSLHTASCCWGPTEESPAHLPNVSGEETRGGEMLPALMETPKQIQIQKSVFCVFPLSLQMLASFFGFSPNPSLFNLLEQRNRLACSVPSFLSWLPPVLSFSSLPLWFRVFLLSPWVDNSCSQRPWCECSLMTSQGSAFMKGKLPPMLGTWEARKGSLNCGNERPVRPSPAACLPHALPLCHLETPNTLLSCLN